MTFRAKPLVKRSHRPAREDQDRRTLYTNIGFTLAIVAALLILVAAAAASWYGDHFGEVAKVNGTTITRDDLRDRVKIETFRLDRTAAFMRTELSAGRMTQEEFDARDGSIRQAREQVESTALERLIDVELQRQLAAEAGVTVSDADVDARLVEEATTKERRHAWQLAIAPETTGDADPTAAQTAAAKAKAERALADLEGGTSWDDVVKDVTRDGEDELASSHDLGWLYADDETIDPAFRDALFAAAVDTPVGVIESDGSFLVGRVSELAAEQVDADYRRRITDEGDMSLETYRKAVRADLLADALEAKVVADVTESATPQRRVSEIYIATGQYQGGGDEVKAKHILFAPNDDPNAAGDLPDDDPAWKKAEDEARAAYDQLKADLSKFGELAKTSDDEASGAEGGDLPYFTRGAVDRAFGDAIFAEGLQPGRLLEPVKSSFGWHVIQFIDRRPDPETRANGVRLEAGVPDADFAALARKYSEGAEAADGGEIGWIAREQLDKALEDAIFATPVGGVSDPVEADDGWHVYKVWEEQTRKPEGEQLDALRSAAFMNWYTAKKDAANIVRAGDSGTATP